MSPTPHELLEFLIATVARKPPAVPFRIGASVARYLDDLAYHHRGEERKLLLLLSSAVWRQVFQFANFQTATKEQTLQFLETFMPTLLSDYDVKRGMGLVSSHARPGKHQIPKVLRSVNLSITMGPGSPRLSDDLTERIYVAYWALRLKSVHGASRFVAETLNRHKIPNGSRQGDGAWSGYDVQARVKQFDKTRERGRNRGSKPQAMIARWEGLYYSIKRHAH
jgi:hypothetical protein